MDAITAGPSDAHRQPRELPQQPVHSGDVERGMLAARAAWAADDETLLVENHSEDFLATLELLGVDPQTLTYRKEMAA